ncbi:dUTP diphosphatase [Desulfothermus sp.]
MEPLCVKVKFLDEKLKGKLRYATELSVGLDLVAAIDKEILIEPGKNVLIGTGIAIEILSKDIAGFVFSRSGLGIKEGLVVTQGVGVIDPDYRGEIKVSLLNISQSVKKIYPGDRIAQLIFMPAYQARLIETSHLSPTKRGKGGFGHTGK